MSMSNIEYSSLKKQAGMHNWGYLSNNNEFDFDLDELDAMDMENIYEPEVLHQNTFGEFYALQDGDDEATY